MKHFVVVLSIIVFVSFVFLHPSIIEDASFNDFEYLQKMRRTHDTVNTDDKSKGWQDNGIFNPWYQPGTGSENDKALNTVKPSVSVSISETNTDSTPTPSSSPSSTPTNEPTKNDNDKTKNLLFLLLIIFVILCVIAILYLYSLNNTNNFRRNYNGSKS